MMASWIIQCLFLWMEIDTLNLVTQIYQNQWRLLSSLIYHLDQVTKLHFLRQASIKYHLKYVL